MIAGRLVKPRRAQDICIFCASRLGKPGAIRRLQTSNGRARPESTTATKPSDNDLPDGLPKLRYTDVGRRSAQRIPDPGASKASQTTGNTSSLPAWKLKAQAAQRPEPPPSPPSLPPKQQKISQDNRTFSFGARSDRNRTGQAADSRHGNQYSDRRQAGRQNGFDNTNSTERTQSHTRGNRYSEGVPTRSLRIGRDQERVNDVGFQRPFAERRIDFSSQRDPRPLPASDDRSITKPPLWSGLPRRTIDQKNEDSYRPTNSISSDSAQTHRPGRPLDNYRDFKRMEIPSDGKFVGFMDPDQSKPQAIPDAARTESIKSEQTPITGAVPLGLNQQSSAPRRRRSALFEEEEADKDKKQRKRASRYQHETEDDADLSPEKLARIEERQRRKAAQKVNRDERASGQVFHVPSFISIGNLATALKIRAEAFSEVLANQGFSQLSNDHIFDAETAGLIASELGFKAVLPTKTSELDLVAQAVPEDTEFLPSRPPIVTIMGHVDHGKTTLLDYLRNSSVAASEHGGITQHIGAFTVQMPSGRIITFLDTPGHAAFLDMRARGANVTDIVVLVVAADDSVKPQTIEAIKHAKAAQTQIVVAISKIDKPEADAEKVKQDLARHGIEVEDYGGEVQTVPVSGKTGEGMDKLEDAIIALADVLDVKADTDGDVEGWVLEAARKASGKLATVLVRRGTLKSGQIIVAGQTWARIRNLRNEAGVIVDEASPGTPVEVDGWDEQPEAGAEVLQAPNEQRARRVVDIRRARAELDQQTANVAAVNEARRLHDEKRKEEKAREAAIERGEEVEKVTKTSSSGLNEVPIIIRADVSGSVEAVNASVLSLGNSEVRADVIRAAVGSVSESDVEYAAAAKGYIVNFNQPLEGGIISSAERSGVRILNGNVIYRIVDDVKGVLEEQLPPIITNHVIGEADILQVFEIQLKSKKTLPVAGCKIRNGTITKGFKVKVIRDTQVIYDGILSTLKNVKKDVTEMRKGNECGISFDDFKDFKVGDQIQTYEVKSEKRHL